jgi:hypothetical protein
MFAARSGVQGKVLAVMLKGREDVSKFTCGRPRRPPNVILNRFPGIMACLRPASDNAYGPALLRPVPIRVPRTAGLEHGLVWAASIKHSWNDVAKVGGEGSNPFARSRFSARK